MIKEKILKFVGEPDVNEVNSDLLRFLDEYAKTEDIINRTYSAMGRKKVCTTVSVSTITDTKPIANIYASTH